MTSRNASADSRCRFTPSSPFNWAPRSKALGPDFSGSWPKPAAHRLLYLTFRALRYGSRAVKGPTGIWRFYAECDQTRREHMVELQEQFGYQAFTTVQEGEEKTL